MPISLSYPRYARPGSHRFRAWYAQQKRRARKVIAEALRYAVLGKDPQFSKDPEFVADFTREYFRTASAASDFDTLFDFTRSGLATMVDSDGVLKWAPHNLITYSEDFSNAAWSKTSIGTGINATVTANYGVAPDGSNTADRVQFNRGAGTSSADASVILQSLASQPAGTVSVAVWLKSNTGATQKAVVYLSSPGSDVYITSVDIGSEWVLVEASGAAASGTHSLVIGSRGSSTYESDQTLDLLVWGAHLYRSDLGGMVNNPFRGDSYVPTTSAAVYLPRLGHHVWDGSQWVNEGLLIESESRTNNLTHSEDFSDADWSKVRCSVTANQAEAPDGTTTADLLTATDDDARLEQVTGLANTIVTSGSIWVKSATGSDVAVQIDNAGLDIQSFTAGSEWQRISGLFDSTGVVTPRLRVRITNSGDSLYIWGAQLEAASTPSSYIPTAGSTATRAAETKDSDSLSHDSSAMWFALEGLETYADEGTAGQVTLFDWRADANNRITVTLDTDSTETGEITLTVVSGGTSWSVAADYLSPGVNQPFSIAWRVTSSEINLAIGGTAQTAVSTTSIPDLSAATASWEGMGARTLFRQGTGDVGDAGISEASS